MRVPIGRPAAILLVFVGSACTKGGRVHFQESTDAGSEDAGDGGPGAPASLVPDGCSHSVPFDGWLTPIRHGEDVYGDAPEPFNLHLGFAADPSTTIAVSWQTDLETRATTVEIGTAPDALDRSVVGWTFVLPSRDSQRRLHEVHVCGLSPRTTYYYRAGGRRGWSPVHSFRTAPAPGDPAPVRFAVLGDSRTNLDIWAECAEVVEAWDPDFVVHTGDAVGVGYRVVEWDWFFEAAAGLLANAPLVMVNGNHDDNAVAYYAQIALPGNEEWYDLRYGDLHFVAGNDTPRDADTVAGEQRDFFDDVLSATDARWRFCIHHKPAYSSGTFWGSNHGLQDAWAPVFDAHHLDVDLAGHDHVYERTRPIQDGTVVDSPAQGTIYTINAGAGAPLYGAGVERWTEIIESVHSYTFVRVEGRTLTWRAFRLADGSLLDRMEIEK